jgi:hypothetical protein
VIDVHGRQVLHLLFGDVEADTVVDPVTAPIGQGGGNSYAPPIVRNLVT